MVLRKYPVRLDEARLASLLAESEASYAQRRPNREDPQHATRVDYFRMFAEEEFRVAFLSYAFEKPAGTVLRLLGEAAADLAHVPELGTPLDPGRYIRALTAALVAGKDDTAAALAAMPRERFTNPSIQSDELTYLIALTLSSLVRGDKAEAARLSAKSATRAGERDVPQATLRTWDTLRALLAAIVAGDPPAFDVAVTARNAHVTQQHGKERAAPKWLLDVEGLAGIKLARAAGLKAADSVYLPASLIGS